VSATTAGALKSKIESLGLSISAYRDQAPEGTALPYVEISEAIAVVPDALEDGAASTGKETVSINVWQKYKTTPGGNVLAESPTLPGAIVRGIHGQTLATAPTRAYAVIVHHLGPRLIEEEPNITQTVIQATIWRVL
jgi:hypothetical protein